MATLKPASDALALGYGWLPKEYIYDTVKRDSGYEVDQFVEEKDVCPGNVEIRISSNKDDNKYKKTFGSRTRYINR